MFRPGRKNLDEAKRSENVDAPCVSLGLRFHLALGPFPIRQARCPARPSFPLLTPSCFFPLE